MTPPSTQIKPGLAALLALLGEALAEQAWARLVSEAESDRGGGRGATSPRPRRVDHHPSRGGGEHGTGP